MRSRDDDQIVVTGNMGMYVIDSNRQLWRVEHGNNNDADGLPVERPAQNGSGWETGRLNYGDDINVDPTDAELAALDECELVRFGLNRRILQPD